MRRIARPCGTCLLAAALALASCAAKPAPPAPMRPQKPGTRGVILLTGFESFAGLETNTSWEVARTLDGEIVADRKVVALCLPVVWEEARQKLTRAVRERRPDAALAMGVGWSGWIEVESTARNRRGPHKDNRRELPPVLPPAGGHGKGKRLVEPGGPEELVTRLPSKRIVERLRALGLPVRESDTAGDYLCNEAFYAILRATADDCPAGFTHRPRGGPARGWKPTLAERESIPVTVDDLVKGIRAALEEMVAARDPTGMHRMDRMDGAFRGTACRAPTLILPITRMSRNTVEGHND